MALREQNEHNARRCIFISSAVNSSAKRNGIRMLDYENTVDNLKLLHLENGEHIIYTQM